MRNITIGSRNRLRVAVVVAGVKEAGWAGAPWNVNPEACLQ